MAAVEVLSKGLWALESSDKFDEYMKALGVGLATRTIANKLKPSQEISVSEDGEWSIKSISTFKNTEIKFRLGEQFDEKRGDGSEVKTTCTVDGNKLIQDQQGEKASMITREFSADKFIMKLSIKDVICTRVYKKV